MANIVAYYRVSTASQGQSGLGLEAQRQAVHTYGTPVAEFTEVESGRKCDRPQLTEALKYCQDHGCQLVVAKLDRLARNMQFICELMDSDIEFTAVDMPAANRLTIHIMAAMAEHEARLCSERTKAGLAAAKARGVKLGGSKCGRQTSTLGCRWAKYDPKLLTQMSQLRSRGDTYGDIAGQLNDQGWRTNTGRKWTDSSVHRVYNWSQSA